VSTDGGRWSPAASASRAGDHHPFNVPPVAITSGGQRQEPRPRRPPATRSTVERHHSQTVAVAASMASCPRGGLEGRWGCAAERRRGGAAGPRRRRPGGQPDAIGTKAEWIWLPAKDVPPVEGRRRGVVGGWVEQGGGWVGGQRINGDRRLVVGGWVARLHINGDR
jgi:hypothetical protein